MLFYKLPAYFDLCCFKHSTQQEKSRSKMSFWKLLLYSLFLIYPGVSSTILRIYICKSIDRQDYLLADLRVRCHTDTWNLYTFASLPLILLYPIGIPAFFFLLLRSNRAMMHDKRIVAQLGFLYAGYTAHCWWFELADTFHKLMVTSVLAFFPYVAQLPVGMVIVTLYLVLLLALNPYLRRTDDLFHIICQVEILLILQVAYVFASLPSGSAYSTQDDIVISLALIAVTMAVFGGFFYTLIRLAYGWAKKSWEQHKMRKEKQAAREARTGAKRSTAEDSAALAAVEDGRAKARKPATDAPSDSESSRSSSASSSGGSEHEASASSASASSASEPSRSAHSSSSGSGSGSGSGSDSASDSESSGHSQSRSASSSRSAAVPEPLPAKKVHKLAPLR
jgi:hypothetical protein